MILLFLLNLIYSSDIIGLVENQLEEKTPTCYDKVSNIHTLSNFIKIKNDIEKNPLGFYGSDPKKNKEGASIQR